MNIYIYIFLVHQKPHDLVHMVKTYVVKRKLWENMILILLSSQNINFLINHGTSQSGGSQSGGGIYGYRLKFWLFYGYRLIFFQLRLTIKLKINVFVSKS